MRRSRYTVTAADGSKHVVLAFDARGALNYYSSRGIDTVGVTKGDYRLTEVVSGSGHRLDQAAIREAIELLGLKRPVRIKPSTRKGFTRGHHEFDHFDNAHDIMVKAYLDPERASRTLWHELAHAMQCERACEAAGANDALSRYRAWNGVNKQRGNRGVGYENKAIEREARSYEPFADDLKLAR